MALGWTAPTTSFASVASLSHRRLRQSWAVMFQGREPHSKSGIGKRIAPISFDQFVPIGRVLSSTNIAAPFGHD
jgi:hypothetical protein